MNLINWNPFNSDPMKVIESKKVSFYKGTPVVRTNFNRSGTFGAIFLQREGDELSPGLVAHEYGHTFQQLLLGPVPYLFWIMIPSAGEWGVDRASEHYRESYYRRPWEALASIMGGDMRFIYSPSEQRNAIAHLFIAAFFGPFSYLFSLG